MADLSLSFDTGERTLELKDSKGLRSVEVTFNPYDMAFLGRAMDMAERLDKLQSSLKDAVSGAQDFALLREKWAQVDPKMKEELDSLFNVPICDTLFPNQTVCAIGGGFPVWANLLFAIVDQMDAGLGSEKERAQERIRKYSKKYKR